MDGYIKVSLGEMLNQIGENRVKSILSNFSCPKNVDIEHFLKRTAIAFEIQGVSKTTLVFAQSKGELVLAGYFTLANKSIIIDKSGFSAAMRRRINRFCTEVTTPTNNRLSVIAAPLIGQLGKNFKDNANSLITGDELLKMACDKVAQAQEIIGGKIVYLECEDKLRLMDFYDRNGFVKFGSRVLDDDEKDSIYGDHLLQMLRYL